MREWAALFDFREVCYFCNTSCLFGVTVYPALTLFLYKT